MPAPDRARTCNDKTTAPCGAFERIVVSTEQIPCPVSCSRLRTNDATAGLLACGSSHFRRLPDPLKRISGIWRYALRSQLRAQPRFGKAWLSLPVFPHGPRGHRLDVVIRCCAAKGQAYLHWAQAARGWANRAPVPHPQNFRRKIWSAIGPRRRAAWGRKVRFASPAHAHRRAGMGGEIRPRSEFMTLAVQVSCRFWRNHVVFRDLRWSRACPFAHAQAPLGTLIGPCADRRGAALRRKVRWTGPRRADIPQFGTDSAFGLRRVDQHLCAIWFSQGGEGAGEQAARQDRAGQHGALTARPDRIAWHVRAQ
jgi:hypothetical protein